MLGDLNADGMVGSFSVAGGGTVNETQVTAAYLLWSAGPDEVFGTVTVDSAGNALQPGACTTYTGSVDDSTNFRQ